MKKQKTDFGERLRQFRQEGGFTQKALAEKIGLHEMSIYRLECGDREPNWSTVLLIAGALGRAPNEFVEPEPTTKKK